MGDCPSTLRHGNPKDPGINKCNDIGEYTDSDALNICWNEGKGLLRSERLSTSGRRVDNFCDSIGSGQEWRLADEGRGECDCFNTKSLEKFTDCVSAINCKNPSPPEILVVNRLGFL